MHRNSNQYLAGHTPEPAYQQRRNKRVKALWIALAVGAATTQAWASTQGETLISPSAYSAPIANNERQLLWGDTHLHSNVSADAFTIGSRLGPDQAYRFAMGLPVTNELGHTARLRAPLDFLAVTDHAEYHGVFPLLEERDAQLDSSWA